MRKASALQVRRACDRAGWLWRPSEKICSMGAAAQSWAMSLGSGSRMLASLAPAIVQEASTSQSAMWRVSRSCFFSGMVCGHFSVEYCGKYLPKAVLRMTVVEPLLARFGRGHRSEHEHAALRIEHRLDLMDDMCFVWCHVLPSSGGVNRSFEQAYYVVRVCTTENIWAIRLCVPRSSIVRSVPGSARSAVRSLEERGKHVDGQGKCDQGEAKHHRQHVFAREGILLVAACGRA